MKTYILVGVSILALVTGAVIYHHSSKSSSTAFATEVDWRLLGEMDYVTGKTSGDLQSLDGKSVRIPGFMVPLEDEQKEVKEFLLVPSAQACVHVPPPPPNQMVYVKMKKSAEAAFGPIWVYGTLKITPIRSMYGEASFELIGELIEEYK